MGRRSMCTVPAAAAAHNPLLTRGASTKPPLPRRCCCCPPGRWCDEQTCKIKDGGCSQRRRAHTRMPPHHRASAPDPRTQAHTHRCPDSSTHCRKPIWTCHPYSRPPIAAEPLQDERQRRAEHAVSPPLCRPAPMGGTLGRLHAMLPARGPRIGTTTARIDRPILPSSQLLGWPPPAPPPPLRPPPPTIAGGRTPKAARVAPPS